MDKLEKIKLTPEELGNSEWTDDYKIVRNPEVKASEYLKNVVDFIDDPSRQAAWTEARVALEQEMDFYNIVDGTGLEDVFYTPANFIEALVKAEAILLAENRIAISTIVNELVAKKEKLIKMRLDYEDYKEAANDQEFKEKLESAINKIDDLIANGNKVLSEATSV